MIEVSGWWVIAAWFVGGIIGACIIALFVMASKSSREEEFMKMCENCAKRCLNCYKAKFYQDQMGINRPAPDKIGRWLPDYVKGKSIKLS